MNLGGGEDEGNGAGGEQVVDAGGKTVPADWFAQATHKQKDIGTPGMGYGFQWWT